MDELDEDELFTVCLDDDGHPVQRAVRDMTAGEVIAAIDHLTVGSTRIEMYPGLLPPGEPQALRQWLREEVARAMAMIVSDLVRQASFAASVELVPAVVAITSTLRPTRSAARAGNRS